MLSIGLTSSRSVFLATETIFVANSAEAYCGLAAGGAVALNFIASGVDGSANAVISYSNFYNNTVSDPCDDSKSLQRSSQTLGGAVFVSSQIALNSSIWIHGSKFDNNSATAANAAGGAVFAEATASRTTSNSTFSPGKLRVSLESNNFTMNNVESITSGSGGAVHIVGGSETNPASIVVNNSTYLSNTADCKLKNRRKSLLFLPCYGGAHAFEHGRIQIFDSHFESNVVGFVVDFLRERKCGESFGGAIGSVTPSDALHVQSSNFQSNFVSGSFEMLIFFIGLILI